MVFVELVLSKLICGVLDEATGTWNSIVIGRSYSGSC